jgi:hypothetical protein
MQIDIVPDVNRSPATGGTTTEIDLVRTFHSHSEMTARSEPGRYFKPFSLSPPLRKPMEWD